VRLESKVRLQRKSHLSRGKDSLLFFSWFCSSNSAYVRALENRNSIIHTKSSKFKLSSVTKQPEPNDNRESFISL